MIVKDLKVRNIRIPLKDPKTMGGGRITHREFTIVNITTQSGIEGWSFVWGAPAAKVVVEAVRELVIGQPAYATAAIWNKVFSSIDRWGRGGVGMRAVAAIDIALWDIVGKSANLPLYKMLGGFREAAPVYYSGGYYPDSCKTKSELLSYLEKEMGTFKDRGFSAFKMKIGAGEMNLDLERIATARKTIGPDAKLMLDANCRYGPETIIAMAAKFEKYDIAWLEEPVAVDDLPNCAYVASRVSMPVALGENHYTNWEMRNIIDYKAGRILQPDPTVSGGLTQYLKLAGMASTYGIKLAPHCFHDFNVQVALCCPEVLILEYMEADSDVLNTQRILQNPVYAKNGLVYPPEGPGHGLILDEKAMEKYAF